MYNEQRNKLITPMIACETPTVQMIQFTITNTVKRNHKSASVTVYNTI